MCSSRFVNYIFFGISLLKYYEKLKLPLQKETGRCLASQVPATNGAPQGALGSGLSWSVAHGGGAAGTLHARALQPANQRRPWARRGRLFSGTNSELPQRSVAASKRTPQVRRRVGGGGSGGEACRETCSCGSPPLGCFSGVRRGKFVQLGSPIQVICPVGCS